MCAAGDEAPDQGDAAQYVSYADNQDEIHIVDDGPIDDHAAVAAEEVAEAAGGPTASGNGAGEGYADAGDGEWGSAQVSETAQQQQQQGDPVNEQDQEQEQAVLDAQQQAQQDALAHEQQGTAPQEQQQEVGAAGIEYAAAGVRGAAAGPSNGPMAGAAGLPGPARSQEERPPLLLQLPDFVDNIGFALTPINLSTGQPVGPSQVRVRSTHTDTHTHTCFTLGMTSHRAACGTLTGG